MERIQGLYYKDQDLLYISDHDIEILVEDLLHYLKYNPTFNPFSFMYKYFNFIFYEKDIYNN